MAATIATDVRLARELGTAILGGVPREMLQITIMSITLALLSPHLFLIFFLGIVPLFFWIKRLGKILKKRFIAALDNYAHMTEWLQQRFLGIETIKHYRTEKIESDKYDTLSHNQFQAFFRAAKVHAIIPQLMEAVTVLALAAALFYSLQELQQESLPLLLAFFSTLALLAQAATRIGRHFNQSREGSAAVARIFTLKSDLEQSSSGYSPALSVVAGLDQALVCENVSVSYDTPVLKNFSYSFRKGKVYGLRGETGSGKSTLMKAILGLVPLTTGKIFFFQQGICHDVIPLYLPQKHHLVAGSLAHNICYPDPVPDQGRVDIALDRACFPQTKRHSNIDFAAVQLSGGQEQRLGIARLFYHRSPLVLIDEGTSALDQHTEAMILNEIRALAADGMIVIMAAHRQAALTKCDVVISLP